MMDTVTRVVVGGMNRQQEAMNRQQASFMKMMEDRDISHRHHETIGENAGNGSGTIEAVEVTEETRETGVKEKGRVSGCSYKGFMSCKPSEFAGTAELV